MGLTSRIFKLGLVRVLGALLTGAACAKYWYFAVDPHGATVAVFGDLLGVGAVSLAVGLLLVSLELVVGQYLCWFARPLSLSLTVAGAAFGFITVFAAIKTLAGHQHCACFGSVVPVATSLVLKADVAVLGLLACALIHEWAASREDAYLARQLGRTTFAAAIGFTCFLVLVLSSVVIHFGEFVGPQRHLQLSRSAIVDILRTPNGNSPEACDVNLSTVFDRGQFLTRGHWKVLIIRANCPRCSETLASLEDRHRGEPVHVALCTIGASTPTDLSQSPGIIHVSDYDLIVNLLEPYIHIVSAPCILSITDGCVARVHRP